MQGIKNAASPPKNPAIKMPHNELEALVVMPVFDNDFAWMVVPVSGDVVCLDEERVFTRMLSVWSIEVCGPRLDEIALLVDDIASFVWLFFTFEKFMPMLKETSSGGKHCALVQAIYSKVPVTSNFAALALTR